MNLWTLTIASLRKRALNSLLNILLLSLGIATIVTLLLVSTQLEDNLYENAEGVDAVVGASGSPVQIILSSVFHMDAPTGNIDLEEAVKVIRHPMVERAIPLALGDNVRGFRLVGTTTEYPGRAGAELSAGSYWDYEFEVVAGSVVAEALNLQVGDTLYSAHGLSDAGHIHGDHGLMVVGILAPTGSVMDQLLLSAVETMWGIHSYEVDTYKVDSEEQDMEELDSAIASAADSDHDHTHAHKQHIDHHAQDDHAGHTHAKGRPVTDTSYLNPANLDEQITSLLIEYRNPLAAAQFPRFIMDQTNLQAAAPAIEITRLLGLLGIGLDAIQIFAYILIFASLLGIFIALLNSMKDRKYDLAIMRSLGAPRRKLFTLFTLEGITLSIAGTILGMILGHTAVWVLTGTITEAQQFQMSAFRFLPEELWLLGISLAAGLIASLIPAIQAYRTDIAETLTKT